MLRKRIKKQKIKPIKLNSDKYDIEALSIFVENNKQKIIGVMLDLICEGIQKDLKTIDVFEFYNSKDILIFKKTGWSDFLENAFLESVKQEEYEVCSKIKEVQKLLKSKTI